MSSSPRAIRIGALAAALAVAFASLETAAQSPCPTSPEVTVTIERVDPSNFPEVDVYFRIVDTVASTAMREPAPQDIRVSESPADSGAFTAADVTGQNFQAPEIRPLAISLAVDRSNSVQKILEKLREAAVRFFEGMSDNGPLDDDVASAIFFAGSNNLSKVDRLPPTTDRDAAMAFTEERMTKTDGGTPLHTSWNVAVRDIAANSYPIRAVLMLTDGKNYPRHSGPPVDSVIQAALANGLPMYNFAFVKFKGAGEVARNSVFPDDMCRMSSMTGGAYFEPIPPFPLIPDPPGEPADPADPDALDDDDTIRYMREVLGLVRNLLNEDPDADFAVFQPLINRLLEPDIASKAEFDAVNLNDDATMRASATTLAYQDVAAVDTALETNAPATVTEEDLRKFYVDQVENMFSKVRASLKRLYRVTYRSPDETWDGTPRDVKVSASYESSVNFTPIVLQGSSVARYIAPIQTPEDVPFEMISSLEPSSPLHQQLFGGAPPPRQGTWKGPTRIEYQIDLMAPGADGRPAVVASRTPDGQVALNAAPDGPASDLAPDDPEADALRLYLSHLELEATPDAGAGTLTVRITAKLPTCVRDPEDLTARPGPNETLEGLRKLLWYRIGPRATRDYDYVLTVPTEEGQPGDNVAETGSVTAELPLLVAYVTDVTPPSLALYITPQRNVALHRVEALEDPGDAPQAPKPLAVRLTGASWTAELDADFSRDRSTGTTEFPLAVEGREVEGFFVAEDVRLELSLLVRDNIDASPPARYLADGGEAPHVVFTDSDHVSQEARDGQSPYLPRLGPEEADEKPGGTLLLEEAGGRTEVRDSIIFRAANVPEGDPIFLEARGRDSTGNVSVVRVPVFVFPVGFDLRQVEFQSKRQRQ